MVRSEEARRPTVTLARAMTDTFAGISPSSVPLFVGGQVLGAAAAALFARWLLGGKLTLPDDENFPG
jgi:glycerol uptake facilitator-like aquaporin